jgi:hypothetical protein
MNEIANHLNTMPSAGLTTGKRRPWKWAGLATVLLAIGSLLALPLAAQARPDLGFARELLDLPIKAALERVKVLNAGEAEALTTQLLSLTRARNPDVDHVYALVRHLETLRADTQAQNRLNTLLTVLTFTLGLFTAFLLYVLFDQRRSLKSLQKMLSENAGKRPESSSHTVYRGE